MFVRYVCVVCMCVCDACVVCVCVCGVFRGFCMRLCV